MTTENTTSEGNAPEPKTKQYQTTCYDGRKVRWSGRQVTSGEWPSNSEASTSIAVYHTKGDRWVGWITQSLPGLAVDDKEDVVEADSEDELIELLMNHPWTEEDEDYLAALQNAYPKRDIWVEEIE